VAPVSGFFIATVERSAHALTYTVGRPSTGAASRLLWIVNFGTPLRTTPLLSTPFTYFPLWAREPSVPLVRTLRMYSKPRAALNPRRRDVSGPPSTERPLAAIARE